MEVLHEIYLSKKALKVESLTGVVSRGRYTQLSKIVVNDLEQHQFCSIELVEPNGISCSSVKRTVICARNTAENVNRSRKVALKR